MPISFNIIPANLRTPGQFIEFDNTRAVQGVADLPKKLLIIAQRLAAGTVLAGIATRVLNGDQAGSFFGRGSYAHAMAAAAKAANKYSEIYVCALDDVGGGTLATATLTVTGPATANGTLYLYIGGRRIQVSILSGDIANSIATKINTAIAAFDDLPCTSGVATNVVTLTARHKGTVAHGIDVRFNYQQGEVNPAGVSVAIVAFAGGTTDPDVQAALTAIGATHYTTIASGLADSTNLGKLETELLNRWGPDDQNEGHCFAAVPGTVAGMQALGNARNSPFSTLFGGGKSPTPPWVIAAVVAAVDDAESDPARPRQNLVLPGVLPPAEADRPIRSERNTLLQDGVSTFRVDAGGSMLIDRLITTYQTNAFAVPDTSYLDVTTMRTLATLRLQVRARIAQRFPRHKLANDGTNFDPGQAIVTPSVIKSELLTLFRQWEGAGLVENFEQYLEDLIVERDANDPNRVNARMSPDLMNSFIVFAGQIQFLL
jgi:phage tail sheath gpL-like